MRDERQMILIFGSTSRIGKEIIKQTHEDIVCVTRGGEIEIEPDKKRNVVTIKSTIEDIASNPSIIPLRIQKQITTIIFSHRYRPDMRDGNYLLEEAFNIEVDSPNKIVKSIKTTSECLRNILFVSSMAAEYVATEQSDAYGLSKACINKLAQELSVRLSGEGISVNTIMLSYVKQEKKISREEGFYQTAEKIIPSKKAPEPEEIADLIVGVIRLANQNRLFSGQLILGDACLSQQTHSSVAEMSRSGKA